MGKDVFDTDIDKRINHPFYNSKVYLSGDFFVGKDRIVDRLREEADATVVPEIVMSEVVVVGFNQPTADSEELVKIQWNGFPVPMTITEDQLLKLLARPEHSEDFKYWYERQRNNSNSKNLDITYDLLFNPIYSPIAHFTNDEDAPTLEDKEVFMLDADDNDGISTDPIKLFLEQKMGAKVTAAFSPRTTDYCLLRESSIERLKRGEKDTYIRMIEKRYNSSNCWEFRPKIILEREVLILMAQ